MARPNPGISAQVLSCNLSSDIVKSSELDLPRTSKIPPNKSRHRNTLGQHRTYQNANGGSQKEISSQCHLTLYLLLKKKKLGTEKIYIKVNVDLTVDTLRIDIAYSQL
ncbi:hypothetical protein PoB_007155500 [Plakobranchus ocellatus]|uniref:Uncharacterized protein n=1 Tax=Plakobranchus ocellatus TaxID=259542 RepID=A0AAV4DMB7_9GAST|nr:hypothetical protein PoB_007155500 [Plakobranchus ocellatus]